MLWPQKRRYVNDNFAHVLGRPPGSLEVKRKALAAYRSYARYVVELMRLPRLSDDQAAALVDTSTLLPLEAYWKASGKGLILTTAHIGNLEGVARGHRAARLADLLARRRHELPRAVRAPPAPAQGVGRQPHPVAQPARPVRRAEARNEILALIIDWGYRPDDIPVRHVRRVDDAAGRPRGARREDRCADRPRRDPPVRGPAVVPGHARRPDRGPVQRPGRAAARDAGHRRRPRGNDRGGAGAVVQLQAILAFDGRGAGGPRGARRESATLPARWSRRADDRGATRSLDLRARVRARAIVAASWLACRLPERPLLALADLAGDLSYRLAPERRRRARRNLARVARWLAEHDLGTPEARAAARDGPALSRLVRDAFRHSARYYVQLARAPIVDAAYLERRLVIDDRENVEALLTAPGGKLFVGMHLGWFELPALIAVALTGRPAIVPSETLARPRPAGVHGLDARAPRAAADRPRRGPPGARPGTP